MARAFAESVAVLRDYLTLRPNDANARRLLDMALADQQAQAR